VAYAYQWPEPSRVDATLTNAAGLVADADVIVLQQGGRMVPRVTFMRTDGKDGDAGFNPIYPFLRRGRVDAGGNVLGGQNVGPRTYAIDLPVVTNAGPLDILARVDGSAVNVLLKLDGGSDLNSHLGLGAQNTFTAAVLDLRDNKPGMATDMFLGYEQAAFSFRFGPEKFAARNTSRNTVLSVGAETYSYHVGSDETTNLVHGSGLGAGYSEETCAWVYHNASDSNNVSGQPRVRQRSSTSAPAAVEVWVKVGYEFQISRAFIYYTTDGSAPEGAYGVGRGTTQVVPAAFAGDDAVEGNVDWWKGTLPVQPVGTVVRYKIGLHKRSGVNPLPDYADGKNYALTQFAVTNWPPASASVWLHNNLNPAHRSTGLAEGFHILRARAFLPRSGKSSVFQTYAQTFYYDTQPPTGAVAFPANDGDTLRSVDYDVVVRADETASEVEFNVQDADPNNDDVNTGFAHGNGLSNGLPVFARAARVTPSSAVSAQFPQLPQEFRFTHFAVPSSGAATITMRVKEFTSATFPGHWRTLTRTVNCAAPPQTLAIAFPSANGEPVRLGQGNTYEIVACFSDTLTADAQRFTLLIDGAEQPRTNAQGQATYRFQGSYCGSGQRDLRYTWGGMAAGQHYLQVLYVGDGLALQTSRLVRVELFGVTDTDGDGLPDTWEIQHGLNPNDATGDHGAGGDPDGDEFTNLEEFLAGTDPQNPTSLLKILPLQAGGREITWLSVPGKNYQVQATSDPTAAFEPLGDVVTAIGWSTRFTNTAPAQAKEFYRVQVLP
jgi:hypothetical protein